MLPPGDLWAADFVVESTVQETGGGGTPQQYLVLFRRHLAFDYAVSRPQNVTVFDFDQECLWRLDQTQQTKQRLSLEALVRLTQEATLRAVRLSPLVQFAAEPRFTSRTWDPSSLELRLEHELLNYRAQLDDQADPEWVSRYREYADWSARLNTLAPGLPPMARIELNREIAMRGAVPRKITCQFRSQAEKVIALESTHAFRPISETLDTVRLAELQTWLSQFQETHWSPRLAVQE
jgi:hypothetical protein